MDSPIADALHLSPERLATLAETMGIPSETFAAFLARGASHACRPGDYLFHESTPRLWMGIVQEGEVDIVRGMHGSTVQLATITAGAAFGEGVALDELPHTTSAFTRAGARVWQIPRQAFDELRATSPDVFYRMVGHIARRLGTRLAAANDRIARAAAAPSVAAFRREHDLLGERELPASSDQSADDEKKKKGKQVALAQKVSRVTVILPPKKVSGTQTSINHS